MASNLEINPDFESAHKHILDACSASGKDDALDKFFQEHLKSKKSEILKEHWEAHFFASFIEDRYRLLKHDDQERFTDAISRVKRYKSQGTVKYYNFEAILDAPSYSNGFPVGKPKLILTELAKEFDWDINEIFLGFLKCCEDKAISSFYMKPEESEDTEEISAAAKQEAIEKLSMTIQDLQKQVDLERETKEPKIQSASAQIQLDPLPFKEESTTDSLAPASVGEEKVIIQNLTKRPYVSRGLSVLLLLSLLIFAGALYQYQFSGQSKQNIDTAGDTVGASQIAVVMFYQDDVASAAIFLENRLREFGVGVTRVYGGGNLPKAPNVAYTRESELSYALEVQNYLEEYGFSEVNLGTFGAKYEQEGKVMLYIYLNEYSVGLLHLPELEQNVDTAGNTIDVSQIAVVMFYHDDVAGAAIFLENELLELGASVTRIYGGGNIQKEPKVAYTRVSELSYALNVQNYLEEYGYSKVSLGTFGAKYEQEGKVMIYMYLNKDIVEKLQLPEMALIS